MSNDTDRVVDFPAWVPVSDGMPEAGVPVLAFVDKDGGKWTRCIRARWIPRHTIEQETEDENHEYVEATDTYYVTEGWYEDNEYEEINWKVHDPVTHWMPLPPAPGVESNVPCHGPWGDLIADAYWFADSYVCGLIDSESTYEDGDWRQMDPDDLHSEWHYAERRGLIEHDPNRRGRFRFTPGREFLGPGVAPANAGGAILKSGPREGADQPGATPGAAGTCTNPNPSDLSEQSARLSANEDPIAGSVGPSGPVGLGPRVVVCNPLATHSTRTMCTAEATGQYPFGERSAVSLSDDAPVVQGHANLVSRLRDCIPTRPDLDSAYERLMREAADALAGSPPKMGVPLAVLDHIAEVGVDFQQDGDKLCATFGDHINLQESPAGFGDNHREALRALVKAWLTECAPKEREQ